MCINEDADGNIQVHACAGVDAVAVGGNGYLNPPFNNIVEQDHRAVKRVTRPMLGFKSFNDAKCILIDVGNAKGRRGL